MSVFNRLFDRLKAVGFKPTAFSIRTTICIEIARKHVENGVTKLRGKTL